MQLAQKGSGQFGKKSAAYELTRTPIRFFARADSCDVVRGSPPCAGDAFGSTSGLIFVRVLPVAPVLTLQPQDSTVFSAYAAGGTATFSANARGTEPLTYQWYFNGAPIAGGTNARLPVPVSSATSGNYSVVASNSVGQTPSQTARLVFDPLSRIVNLASRGLAGTGENALIVGFAVSGAASKQFLVRAAGLALAQFGVLSPLVDPVLTVVGPGTTTVATNDNWGDAVNAAEISTTSASVGAFALAPSSKDAAVLVTLQPGAYTVLVSGANATSGIALVEVYEIP